MTVAIVTAGTAEGQSCPQITDPQPLNTNAPSDTWGDVTPRIATDEQGVWVVVWASSDYGGKFGTDWDIFFARSTDNGATWTDPAPLDTNADSDIGDDEQPDVATDGAGNWVAVWSSNDDLGGSVGTDTDVFVSRSADNGASWTDPEPLNTNAASDTGDDGDSYYGPKIATDGAGQWVVAWWSDDDLGGTIGTDRDILFALSTDNGATWADPAPLNTNASSDSGIDFSGELATDGAGHWVAVWNSRDDLGGTIGVDYDILYALSSDNGITWSAAAALNSNADSDTGMDVLPLVTTDGAGQWVAVWSSREDLGGTIGSDLDILFAVSADNGATWSAPAALNATAASDSFHSEDFANDLATDGAGNWVAAWKLLVSSWGDADIVYSLSTNNGTIWSDPAALNSNADTDGMWEWDEHAQLSTDGAGNWVAVWDSSNELGGTIGLDPDILFARFELLPCPANFNADCVVSAADLAQLLGAWGPNPGHPADLDGDDVVGPADLALLLGSWGDCP